MREKFKASDNVMDMMITMSEGNPGASRVLVQFADNPSALLDMDDMNIRGCQVWVAFKDFAGQDIDVLKSAVRERSSDMVEIINKESGIAERAVTSGGSYKRV